MPTILEIIAESEKLKRAGGVKYTDNVPYEGLGSYSVDKDTFSGTNPVPQIHNLERVTTIGAQRLQDTKDFNLFQPQTYEDTQIEVLPIGVINSPDPETVASQKYFQDVLLNQYLNPQGREKESIENPLGLTPQFGSYLARVESIKAFLDSRTLVDVFLGTQSGEDSEIGTIGADALRGALEVNFKENLSRVTLGRINSRLFDILQQETLFRKDYSITVNPNPLVRSVEVLQNLQGVTFPFSYCPPDMFDLENNEKASSMGRYSEVFKYTGKGNRAIIYHNLSKNLYRPSMSDDGKYTIIGNYYAFSDSGESPSVLEFNAQYLNVEELSVFGEQQGDPVVYPYYGMGINGKNAASGSEYLNGYGMHVGDESLTQWEPTDWSSESINRFSPKSLLWKTKQIALENSDLVFIDSYKKEFLLKQGGEELTISRGSTMTSKGGFTLDDDVSTVVAPNEYFRAFTKGFKYNQLARAIRHRGLDSGETRTVLQKNGIPRYMPTNTDEGLIKRTFFSLENLAWKNNIADLPPCERGNPDINGNLGRFMSFPPYDLKFSESIEVDFKDYSFISRGEKVYAYNNTTRTGQLSFSMIVDHPDMVNKGRGMASNIWERYFAGDKSVQAEVDQLVATKLSPSEREQLNLIRNKPSLIQKQVQGDVLSAEDKSEKELENKVQEKNWLDEQEKLLSIYFPNESTVIPDAPGGNIQNNAGYEAQIETLSSSDPLFYTYVGGIQKNKQPEPYQNQYNYGLNKDFYETADTKIKTTIKALYDSGVKDVEVYVYGFSSKATTNAISNERLSLSRANGVKVWFEKKLDELGLLTYGLNYTIKAQSFSDKLDTLTNESTRKDDKAAKEARRVDVTVIGVQSDKPQDINDPNELVAAQDVSTDPIYGADADQTPPPSTPLSPELYEKLFYSECDWFDEIKIQDPLRHKSISENIKHFHPAYHSISPSSFHRRLTFLQQCTRQGSSEILDKTKPNLAFGTQPLLKLMIGDFFYTYILITNMEIQYDVDNGVLWDTNPEGIGVQPMMCKVSMNIVFLGSQSLSSPINRLNNALSFNFYSNTSSYDARANDVVFSSKVAEPDKAQFEAELVEGIRLSEVYNTDANALNVQNREALVQFRNMTREDIINSQQPNDAGIDNTDLEIDDLRDSMGLKKYEVA